MSEKDRDERCDCASKGIKIHTWDKAPEWVKDRGTYSMVKTERWIHTPCGRVIEQGAVPIITNAA